jgi:hypothetical protein
MEEGLDGDDAYIMVEDEFEVVARSFTQHLHHAEYIRLKNNAKAQNASTIHTISRPVDTITKMREETKRRKESETRAAKQKNALQQMKAQSGRPKTDDEESDSDGIAADDPWIGTSLQGLMTSPKKLQTSLTGLGGVKSNTRAAAGYAKAEKKSMQSGMPFDLEPERTSAGAKTSRAQAYSDATTSDDDDLDAPAARKALSPDQTPTRKMARELLARVRFADLSPGRHENPLSRERSSPPSLKVPAVMSSTSSKYSWKKPKSMFDPFDDLPVRTDLAKEASHRIAKRATELKTHRAREERTANKKVMQSEEIPVFLV